MLSLLRVSVTKRAVITADLDHDLPPIQGSSAQIRQVAMNLVTNASDAMVDRDGAIRVTSGRTAVRGHSLLADGEYVRLEVSDTGCGMSPQVQANVFDPFFTTKSAGRGLGLAVVQGIVRSLGGAVDLTSELERGTTFRILLPCAAAAPASNGRASSRGEEPAVSSRRGTLLVVEDEDHLRRAVVKLLRKTGFEVFEAADGFSAIELLRAEGDKIDAILLDATVPGASSRQIVAEAANAWPGIRVVLTSAYSREAIADEFAAPQIRSFIRKPFLFADLLKTLHSSLS
jgi:CheY-like chemotaxis protein